MFHCSPSRHSTVGLTFGVQELYVHTNLSQSTLATCFDPTTPLTTLPLSLVRGTNDGLKGCAKPINIDVDRRPIHFYSPSMRTLKRQRSFTQRLDQSLALL